jgi:putative transposase
MIKNHKLAESIQSLSFGRFREILTYKCDWYGRDLVVIDRFYPSSKLCSNCGYKNKDLTLNDRNWCCPVCDTNHDRDLNASININKEGLRLLNNKIGGRTTELTLVDIPLSGE